MAGVAKVFRVTWIFEPTAENRMRQNGAHGVREYTIGFAAGIGLSTDNFRCLSKSSRSQPIHPLANTQQQTGGNKSCRGYSFSGASAIQLFAELVHIRVVLLVTAQSPREVISFPRGHEQVFRRERLFEIASRAVKRGEQHLLAEAGAARTLLFCFCAHHAALA
jgi:hypothetical protein